MKNFQSISKGHFTKVYSIKRPSHCYIGVFGYRQYGGWAWGVAKSTLFYVSFKVGSKIFTSERSLCDQASISRACAHAAQHWILAYSQVQIDTETNF